MEEEAGGQRVAAVPLATSSRPVYHEKQVKQFCALHALNNLFQDGSAFSKELLDDVCRSLSPDNMVNPHKSALGLGNYDVNVVMCALQERGYEALWFDKRKDPSCVDLTKILGFILNVPGESRYRPFSRNHWFAIREVDGVFYNLDSKLMAPLAIGKSPDLLKYLRQQIMSKNHELFVVVTQDIGRACYKDANPSSPSSQL